jgi:hypothetical protein
MVTSGLLGASGSSTMANSDFVVRERVIADAGCSDAQSRASAWSCVPWQVGGGRHGTQWLISPDLFPKQCECGLRAPLRKARCAVSSSLLAPFASSPVRLTRARLHQAGHPNELRRMLRLRVLQPRSRARPQISPLKAR